MPRTVGSLFTTTTRPSETSSMLSPRWTRMVTDSLPGARVGGEKVGAEIETGVPAVLDVEVVASHPTLTLAHVAGER